MTLPKSFHGKHVEQGDKFAVEYAEAKYAPKERDIAIRAFRHGWEMFFDGVAPELAWDKATAYAWNTSHELDYHLARLDCLAGYNKADQYRRTLRKGA